MKSTQPKFGTQIVHYQPDLVQESEQEVFSHGKKTFQGKSFQNMEAKPPVFNPIIVGEQSDADVSQDQSDYLRLQSKRDGRDRKRSFSPPIKVAPADKFEVTL